MSSKVIVLGGSLLVAGGIYFAVRSTVPFNAAERTVPAKEEPVNAFAVSDTTFRLPQGPSKFPALLIKKSDGDTASAPLRVSNVKVDVKVSGNIATTLYDLTYCNDLDRILDGQFCFPLGEGQTISYFALELDGKLREASVVEKAKGRITYEAVIRRKIDPALLEWTAGNNFRTRVYPIPAKGCKRIVVGFEQELVSTGRSYLYYQPLLFTDKLEKFSVHAEVLNQPARPSQFDEQGIAVKFESAGESWVYDKTYSGYSASRPLAFEIPQNEKTRSVFVEQADGGNAAFYLNLQPKIFRAEKKLPQKVCVLWDVSGSSEKRNLDREKNLLCAYLKKTGSPKVNLVTFSNEIHSGEEIEIASGNTRTLEEKLAGLVYDGGTQLGQLDLSAYNCDEFILVTDGISNFGEKYIKTGRTPVHVICSSPLSDYSMLKGICQSTGGKFLNLQSVDSLACLEQLGTEEYHFISAEYDENAVREIYPSSPVPVTKSFSMAGILETYKAEITLNFGIGAQVLHKEKITVYNEARDYKGMIRKAWAQKKLNELDIFYERNEESITSLGKKYNIVTRNTSLLVLDRLEDYIEHKVEPKDPGLRKQYLEQADRSKRDWLAEKKAHLEQVVADFDELKKWYDTDYTPKKLFDKKAKEPLSTTVTYAVADSTVSLRGARNEDATVMSESNKDGEVVQNNISLTSNATGGTATYGWSNGLAASSLNQLVEGTYKVSVTDANACTWDFGDQPVKGDIQLNAWDPQTPYMRAIKSLPKEMAYKKYLELKKKYAAQPSYFVDVADYFVRLRDNTTAIRILSNIAELELENHQLLRVLAHRLQQLRENKLAISVYKKILEIREEEPQSYRDLGLAYADNQQYQEAVDYLCKVVNRRWDGRFPQVEAFVAAEINNIVALHGAGLNLDSLDRRLIRSMPCDVRVVINWDTDNCDMDLWVTDPAEEKCYYGYALTQSGGRISRDFTGGYGPEVFMIKKAAKGEYKVQVNYFGTSSQGLLGPTTVQAELYTNWGRPTQTKKTITLRLEGQADIVDIGALAFVK